jgi:hypothetical protein
MLTLILLLTNISGDWTVNAAAWVLALAVVELFTECGFIRLAIGRR